MKKYIATILGFSSVVLVPVLVFAQVTINPAWKPASVTVIGNAGGTTTVVSNDNGQGMVDPSGFYLVAVAATSTMSVSSTSPSLPWMSPSSDSIVIPANTAVRLACPVTLSYMKLGNSENNKADVYKLQYFLKSFENADVPQTGIFDERTDAAVKAFQQKYANDVLAPWDATKASGIVRITTAKKINSIVCKSDIVLNSEEATIIADFRRNNGSSPLSATVNTVSADSAPTTPEPAVGPAAPSVQVVPSPVESPSQSVSAEAAGPAMPSSSVTDDASASSTSSDSSDTEATTTKSSGSKFMKFIRGLF